MSPLLALPAKSVWLNLISPTAEAQLCAVAFGFILVALSLNRVVCV